MSCSSGEDVPLPHALILSPTRELCCQLEEQAKQLMRGVCDIFDWSFMYSCDAVLQVFQTC